MSVIVNFRTDETVKQEAETLFAELGFNMSTALNVFLKTAIREKGFPFPVSLANSSVSGYTEDEISEIFSRIPLEGSFNNEGASVLTRQDWEDWGGAEEDEYWANELARLEKEDANRNE